MPSTRFRETAVPEVRFPRRPLLGNRVIRGGKPPHPLTALFFGDMVTVVGYWTGKITSPPPMPCPARLYFRRGFLHPGSLLLALRLLNFREPRTPEALSFREDHFSEFPRIERGLIPPGAGKNQRGYFSSKDFFSILSTSESTSESTPS